MKKALSVLLALMMVLTTLTVGVVTASAAEAPAAVGSDSVIYFDANSCGWNDGQTIIVYCYDPSGQEQELIPWGSNKKGGMKNDGTGLCSFDFEAKGIALTPGKQYSLIFNHNGLKQTHDLLFDSSCFGDTAVADPNTSIENPADSSKHSLRATWKSGKLGPAKCITSIGHVVGDIIPAYTSAYGMFVNFLADTGASGLQNALNFSDGKTAQEIIDETAAALELNRGDVAQAINEVKNAGGPDWSGDWDRAKSTLPDDEPDIPHMLVETPDFTSVSSENGFVQLKWNASAGAVRYCVFFSPGTGAWSLLGDTTATSYRYKNVASGKTYQFRIQAIGEGDAVSDPSAIVVIKYIAPPAAKAVKNVYGGVTFTYTKAKGTEKVRIFRKTGSGKWTKLGDTASASFTDKKAVSGKKYTYAARVISKDGSFSSALGTTKSITYIAAPTLGQVTKGKGYVKFTWKKSAGAVKYRVFRKVGKGKWAKLADTKSLSIVDKKVKKNTKYTYTVACITANGKTVVSAYNPTGKAITYK